MISDKTVTAIVTVTLIALVMGGSALKKVPKPKPQQVVAQPLDWSVPDLNQYDCISTGTPEEWVSDLDEPHSRAVKSKGYDGSVTITKYIDPISFRRWVLYPTRLACLESISRFKYVIQQGAGQTQ